MTLGALAVENDPLAPRHLGGALLELNPAQKPADHLEPSLDAALTHVEDAPESEGAT
jgi:hypothetical protein